MLGKLTVHVYILLISENGGDPTKAIPVGLAFVISKELILFGRLTQPSSRSLVLSHVSKIAMSDTVKTRSL